MVPVNRFWKTLAVAASTACLVLGACQAKPSRHPDAGMFRRMILAFAHAAGERDTVALAKMALDSSARADAAVLIRNHAVLLREPEERIGFPHYVTVRGDTAVAMLFVDENGRQEFGAEFRRVGSVWRIARIGFSPK